VKATGASTHFDGFIVNSNINSADNSINDFPARLDNGPSVWTPPPFIDPTVLNNQNAHFWQRSDSGRPSEFYAFTFDIQHELSRSMVFSAGYSGTKGTYLSSGLTRYNQIDPKYIDQYGVTLLNSGINSAAARTANIPIPYTGFGSITAHTVRRALQPFPQYDQVLTNGGQPESVGEKSGNSTYHALILKLDRRYSNGLTILSSYVFSKMFTNAETALIGGGGALDHFNRALEKGLSGNDQTHVARITFSLDLPFGRGRHFSLRGPMDAVLGGWGVSGITTYESGTPMSVSHTYNPIGTGSRVFITSYDNWRAPISGDEFDPFKDVWWNASAFDQGYTTAQLSASFGNATRNNPKTRSPWNLSENIALAKSIQVKERFKFTLRGEAFNIANRVRWGGPSSGVNSAGFGQVRGQGNTPRRFQLALKMDF
jgi:hypothetical protein